MRMVRFHKHQLNYWLNGDEHWLLQGQHYEAHESEEDILKKLRNAAWYRGTTVDIRVYPDRIWVKAREETANAHRPATKHRTVESRLDAVEKENQALRARVEALEKIIDDHSNRLWKVEP